jgi:hypothetical protein
MSLLQKLQTRYRNACIGVACFAPVLAMATPTDPFDGAITTLTTRVTSYGGALVGLAVVGVGFMVAIKYVKKIRGAA